MADVRQKKVVQQKGNFSIQEDELLCHIYLEISQDPIDGVNQKKDKVWARITELWNQDKDENQTRTSKSLQSRFVDLTYCVSKFRGVVRQVEDDNPSGANEKDICAKAKQILLDDPNFTKKKLQFDHVWHILKDAEKWADTDEDEQELYNDELDTSRRPIGREMLLLLSTSNSSQKLAIQREREENKIMLTSLDTITDPEGREYLRSRKAEIMERRARQSRQLPAASDFGNFNNINQFQGGSQGSFNSGNFASPFQFRTTFGGYGNHHGGAAGYGGVPHYGGSDGSGTSDAHGGARQFRDSGGSETPSGYGLMPEHGRDDDDLTNY
uniref:uncharacterized protein LOC101314716 n=1 Tax=Fragaria vesca subsp. vesca TaxID=101020 RepID=UPI0005C7F691|nr:PREDICTED: uncharacterized protein LOC101314716 [Fragaria vesca subsp. vesca]